MVFEHLGLNEALLRAIEEQKFDAPTEIQEQAIPIILEGKDVIAGSKTGSGKTLAFGCGIMHNTKKGQGVQALVLTPTRELAEQVAKNLRVFSKYDPLKIVPIYGGLSITPQIEELRTADVVIGTPGRVLDHLERRTLDLRKVRTLVLDEADTMLDMGFIEDVERIIRQCSSERQTLFFSATITPEVSRLADNYMNAPAHISVTQFVDPTQLKQVFYDVKDNIKFSVLVHLLKNESSDLVMVFCNSRSNVDFVAKNLKLNGIEAESIHGGLTQARRNKILEKFHSGKTLVLVCTDVAARGLDIPDVSHVYNYDIPKDSKQYIHRIGRTARAGKDGTAINILASRDHENFDRVLRDNRVEIIKMEVPYVERVKIQVDRSPRDAFRGNMRSGRQERGERRSPPRQQQDGGRKEHAPPRFGAGSGFRR